eukprot:2618890-Prorocentrum_lima.AAC.1
MALSTVRSSTGPAMAKDHEQVFRHGDHRRRGECRMHEGRHRGHRGHGRRHCSDIGPRVALAVISTV